MKEADVRREALDELVKTVRQTEGLDEFYNPDREFFCRHVVLNAASVDIQALWSWYVAEFDLKEGS